MRSTIRPAFSARYILDPPYCFVRGAAVVGLLRGGIVGIGMHLVKFRLRRYRLTCARRYYLRSDCGKSSCVKSIYNFRVEVLHALQRISASIWPLNRSRVMKYTHTELDTVILIVQSLLFLVHTVVRSRTPVETFSALPWNLAQAKDLVHSAAFRKNSLYVQQSTRERCNNAYIHVA